MSFSAETVDGDKEVRQSTAKMISSILFRYRGRNDVSVDIIERKAQNTPLTFTVNSEKANIVVGESIGVVISLSKDFYPRDRIEEEARRYTWAEFRGMSETGRATILTKALVWGRF